MCHLEGGPAPAGWLDVSGTVVPEGLPTA